MQFTNRQTRIAIKVVARTIGKTLPLKIERKRVVLVAGNRFLEQHFQYLDDLLRQINGFRIDAPVPWLSYRDPQGLSSRGLWNEHSRSWDELRPQWPR
ncbi:hypothetical protein KSF_084480 [Reticulibacter mediterranei]|uniref:Uncharacterized protein n=1 Tax=Reticulibacter mediterranei TaxID=2778369 RepID=A0A8J3IX22_9CHLR|nr:hypothetical protein KSF_084480 [Reticulibacter mediterranei]